jgi:hypothetical protein
MTDIANRINLFQESGQQQITPSKNGTYRQAGGEHFQLRDTLATG